MAQNLAAPIWMTFKQALELDAVIRKGEKGSLVVYASSIRRKETDESTGDEIDREIPFLNTFRTSRLHNSAASDRQLYSCGSIVRDAG
jgi:antirestriction protein ArdC